MMPVSDSSQPETLGALRREQIAAVARSLRDSTEANQFTDL